MSRWWFPISHYFHPESWGFMVQFDENIFSYWVATKAPARFVFKVKDGETFNVCSTQDFKVFI